MGTASDSAMTLIWELEAQIEYIEIHYPKVAEESRSYLKRLQDSVGVL